MASLKQLNIDASNLKASSFPLGSLNISTPTPNINVFTFGSFAGSLKWFGGVLAPNGKIYGIPGNSTTVLEIDVGSCYDSCPWALSPLVNKF